MTKPTDPDAVLHGGAVKPATRSKAEADPPGTRRCPECLGRFDVPRAQWRKMFCCDAHKVAYNNRQTKRGRVLVPLVLAERITRSGWCRDKQTGILARQKSRQLMDGWNREDREAGRMPADDYIALRQRLGFNDAEHLTAAQLATRRESALQRMSDAELLRKLQETRSETRLEQLRAERRRRDQLKGAPTK